MNANLEIAKELALISIDITTIVDSRFPDEVRQEAHMRMQDRVETITTLYEGACQKIPEMSRTEWAQLSSRIFSDYLVFKGAGKGWHLAKEIPTAIQESRFLNHIYSRTASILETMPEVATAEGMVFKVPKKMEETSTLMHEAEKVGQTVYNLKSIEIFEKNAKHIFRNAPGHLLDTATNRQLLIDVASDTKNFLGYDKYKTVWFAKITDSGKQIWVGVRENSIRYGGLNDVPKRFNSETGLCKLVT